MRSSFHFPSALAAAVLPLALAAGAMASVTTIPVSKAPAAASPVAAATPSHDDLQFFESRIRPVLVEQCYKCHSHDADKVKGGLMLDTHEGLMHGGSTGPALVPGNPDDSLLIQAIRYTDEDLKMPPKGNKLPDAQIADLTEWVRRGAPDPRSLTVKGSSPSYGGVGRDHWSFHTVKAVAVPVVKDAAWCQTPVDNFIVDKLETNGMRPNPAADRRTLIRRVTFDLTGLPPTEDDIQAFLNDKSPDAYAKVVDRLLASPQYGEHWGRYWLDVARYADTKGDPARRTDPRFPDAWTYRDYVIDAFNTDKPYNQFILEQLAADRLIAEAGKNSPKPDPSTLAALGFLTLGNQFEGRQDDIISDRIDVTSKAFLGLTVACARCHDHKFDPIPQKDYYSLYGVFANTSAPTEAANLPLVHPVPETAELSAYLAKVQELAKQKQTVLDDYDAFRRERIRLREPDPKGRKELERREEEVESALGDLECDSPGAPPRANVLTDVSHARDYPVLIRGEVQNKGDVVPRHFLEILSPDPKNRPAYRDGSGRLELARDIASPTNPMTARVLVNRVWQQLFGQGFVTTPDDLGNMSASPSHPELLDYLAGRFVAEGWSIKKLNRLIVLSSVYQESGAPNPAYAETDPDNKLLWRSNLRRLDFEEVHDSLLAIAGTLDLTMGGKSIPISGEDFATRRAVYTYIDRHNTAELLTQFDFPSPNVPTGRRYQTIVPQQSLFLMNSPMVIETARKLVHRPDFLQTTSDEKRVESLYLAVFQRPPTAQETKMCLHYVKMNPGGTSTDTPAQTRESLLNEKQAEHQAELQAKAAEFMASHPKAKMNVQPEPAAAAFKSRAPLDAWTKLAHALFQTNEAMFFD